ncbi:hypothetical protein PIB30_042408 [Stylosanthes scabra]|uniref:Uncharacterized protein n=1 Tax=Stylosanthes scabra TaxID=79078 RepID=A0ABU6YDK3_9FABA|nr:hypothetical protein [Stylosanthes scabra]
MEASSQVIITQSFWIQSVYFTNSLKMVADEDFLAVFPGVAPSSVVLLTESDSASVIGTDSYRGGTLSKERWSSSFRVRMVSITLLYQVEKLLSSSLSESGTRAFLRLICEETMRNMVDRFFELLIPCDGYCYGRNLMKMNL